MVTPEKKTQNERAAQCEKMISPGEQLRQAREANGATLSVVAARTRISETTLFHLENDMFDEFAVEIFLKGHLRSYARDLGLEPERIVRAYEKFVGVQGGSHVDCVVGLDPLSSAEVSRSEYASSTSTDAATQTCDSVRRSFASNDERVATSINVRPQASQKQASQKQLPVLEPTISSRAVSGKHRKVIGRFDSQGPKDNVRRGPLAQTDSGRSSGKGLSAVRGTKPLFSITERIFNRSFDQATTEQGAPLRQRLNGGAPATTTAQVRRSSQSLRVEPQGIQPRSKLERAIPQLKQFGAKHFIAILAILVGSLITVGLLSGNRATAQDPAKFPKNSQDSWELERQAEQTRWLLEQPDGQVEAPSTKGNK